MPEVKTDLQFDLSRAAAMQIIDLWWIHENIPIGVASKARQTDVIQNIILNHMRQGETTNEKIS